MLLVRFEDLFDDLDAQVQLVHEVAGRGGGEYSVREVHLHQPLRHALSSGHDVTSCLAVLVVGALYYVNYKL